MLNRSGCELTLKAWTNFKNFYEQEIKTLFIQGGERVVFNDAAIALDLNGNAGITERTTLLRTRSCPVVAIRCVAT